MNLPMLHIDRRARVAMPVLAMAFTLVLPIACSGANDGTGAATTVQGDLIAMLPANATTVGYLDIDALRTSQLYTLFDANDLADSNDEFEEMFAKTGIDPRTDLHRVAFASTAAVTAGAVEGESAIVAVTTFDRARLLAALAAADTLDHAGTTLYLLESLELEGHDADGDEDEGEDDSDGTEGADDSDDDADTDDGVLAILDDQTLAIGQEQAVRNILAVVGGAASARTNTELMALLDDVDPSSEIWVVSAREGLLGQLRPSADMPMPQIPVDKVNAIIFSARLAAGVDLTLRGRTGAEADAKLLGDSLNGMLAFGKMMLQSNQPELFGILDRGVTAGSSGFDVTVKATLSVEDLTALREFAKEAMSPGNDQERVG